MFDCSIAGSGRRTSACAVLLTACLPFAATIPATAQQQLPGVVVQSATIEAKAPRPPTSPPAPASSAGQQSAAPTFESVAGPPAEPSPAGPAGSSPGTSADGIPAERVGSSVTVVTRDDLQRLQVRNGADALRSLPGVSVSRSGGPGNTTAIRLRGAEAQHTQVLIDGIEVNPTNDNRFDFANLAVEDIERIEVLRGPQSGLYGSGSLGGTINIVTRSGRGPLTIALRSEIGSMDTADAAVTISGGTDRAHGILSLYGRRSDGFGIAPGGPEEDGARLSSFTFAGGFKLADNVKIDGTLRRSGLETDRDGFDFVAARNGLVIADDNLSETATDIWLGRVSATLDTFADGRWVQRLSAGRAVTTVLDEDRGAFGFSDTQSVSQTKKFAYTSTVRLDTPGLPQVRHYATGQIERQDFSFEQPTNFDPAFAGKRERSTRGLVGELRGEYFDTLFLSGVVRRDDNDAFDDFTTWRASASLKIPATIFRLHGSLGTGVKYPSFSELFGVFSGFRPNPDLQPETSRGWDAGVETTLAGGRAVLDVTYFTQNLENEIDGTGITGFDANGFFFSPVNLTRESKREGVEIAGRWQVTSALTIGAAYTYLNAREFDRFTQRYVEEVRRAPHSGRVDVSWAFMDGRGSVALGVAYNGEMADLGFPIDFSDRVRLSLDEYWLVTAAASWRVSPAMEIYGRIENALDQKYEEVFGFSAAPLAVYGGVRMTFEDPSTATWTVYR